MPRPQLNAPRNQSFPLRRKISIAADILAIFLERQQSTPANLDLSILRLRPFSSKVQNVRVPVSFSGKAGLFDLMSIRSSGISGRRICMATVHAEESRLVAGVRFQKIGKLYHFDYSTYPELQTGDFVIVDTLRGRQMGQVMGFTAPDSNRPIRQDPASGHCPRPGIATALGIERGGGAEYL